MGVIVPMIVMCVTAMLIVMVMMVVMVVCMTMDVLVRRVVLRGVIVLMAVAMMIVRIAVLMIMEAAFIGATLGIERRLDLDHARAQSPDHGFDDVVPADAQALCHDLRRQMPVAEMPGDADQMLRIARPDLEQRLGRRHHFNQSSILQHQRIAATQRHRIFQVEQEFEAARCGHRHPPPVAVVEVEHDRVGRRVLPAMLRGDFCRTDHAINPR